MSAARWERQYSGAQKDALCKAVLEDGHKISKACEMAAAGELGVPPFRIGREAYCIVKKRMIRGK